MYKIKLDHLLLDGEINEELVNLDIDKISFTKINKISKINEETEVYDLVVENVPNYVTNNSIVHNGGGKRKGSFAIYLEPWHSDILDFLELRKNHGKEEMRTRDLFTALWTPDYFFECVNNDADWYLFSPDEAPNLSDVVGDEFVKLYTKYVNENKFRKKIKARDLWDKILDSQMETGTPYMLAKDAANLKSNQQNLGVIKSSNLCITGDQRVVTDMGYLTAKELHDLDCELNLFNNNKLIKSSKMKFRGENEDVYKVTLENGLEHKITHNHGLPVVDSRNNIKRIECKDLKIGDKIQIQTNKGLFGKDDMCDEAYLLGLYQSDGTQNKSSVFFDIWENDFDLLNDIENKIQNLYIKYNYKPRYKTKGGKFIDASTGYSTVKKKRLSSMLFKNEIIFEKGFIPKWIWTSNEKTQWEYIKGLLQADGTVYISKSKGNPLQISYSDINLDFIKELQLLFNNLGLQTSIRLLRKSGKNLLPDGKGGHKFYNTKECYRLDITNKNDALVLEKNTGFLKRKNINIENKIYRNNTKKSYKIKSIEYVGKEDVYCPTVYNDEHIFISQGIRTFNCTEIIEYSDDKEQAVCNLASIAVSMFVDSKKKDIDYTKLYDVTYQVTVNLNKVIDINYYPTKETKRSNMRHRPIGIGVQGLADAFAKLNIPFDSDKAKTINKNIFETIYFASMTASKDLAIKDGKYESFDGSPLSKGIFQFDMWKNNTISNIKHEDGSSQTVISESKDIELSGMWDWETLRSEVIKHGTRNSLLLAPMPTASTSQILGNNEAFEPFTSNIYKRNTLSGEFVLVNKYLVYDLIKLNLWNDEIRNKIIFANGSIQNIDEIPESIKNNYKTVWEIKLKDQIDMSADRGAFICQSQSFNLHVSGVNKAKITTALMYGWRKGLKTLSYYIRSESITNARKDLGIDNSKQVEIKNEDITCSLDNPEDCLACGS
jgi:ribonucleoside-diphosphate reductase alpha chain